MEDILRILGDGLSIASLAVIFSTSLSAQKRIKPGASVPLGFSRQGEPVMRKAKAVALWALPALSVVILFLPTASGLAFELMGDEAIMMFGMRGIMSAALALRHIVHMQKTIELMDEEGQLQS